MAAALKLTTVMGARIQYRQVGTDNPDCLILLHGLGGDHRWLMNMAGGIGGFDIVALDLPGFGLSGAMPAPYTMDTYAAVLEEFRTHLGHERIHVTGHSLGANVALVYAAQYGPALASLCLLNPVFQTAGLTTALARLYYEVGVRLKPPMDRLWLVSRAAVYIGDMLTFTTNDRVTRRAILAQDYITMGRADLRAIKQAFLSYLETPWEEHAARITARTLIVTGSRDTVARPAAMKRLQGLIAGSTMTVVPGGGHLLPAEQPGPVRALVNQFLTGVIGAQGGGQRPDSVCPRQPDRTDRNW